MCDGIAMRRSQGEAERRCHRGEKKEEVGDDGASDDDDRGRRRGAPISS